MKRRTGLLLVTLFMALIMSGKGGWQVYLSDITIQLNLYQSR